MLSSGIGLRLGRVDSRECIGYGVVPWKRNKCYAKKAFQLILDEIKYFGLPDVELITDIENEVR